LRGTTLPAPRRASLQASAATCSAPTFAALSSRRLRGFAPRSGSTKLYRPGTLRERDPASQAIYSRGECSILRATQAFQLLNLIFLQLENHSTLAARGSAVGNPLGTNIEQDCRIGKKMLNLFAHDPRRVDSEPSPRTRSSLPGCGSRAGGEPTQPRR
jgi:hypothetical protein